MTNYFRKPAQQNRVVVTGMGGITPLGNNLEDTWKNILKGVSGIAPITLFDPKNFKTKIAGEVKQFNGLNHFSSKEIRTMDRFIQFTLLASKMALESLSVPLDFENLGAEAGVIMGSGMGGLPGVEEQFKRYLFRGANRVSPFFIPSVLANMAPARVAMRYNIQGPNFSVKSACATGIHCIGEAYRHIRDGRCQVMLAGSSEATICELSFSGFEALDAMSTRNSDPLGASRPWDQHRDGFLMSEGAGVLILESLQHAKERNANILAEVIGYAATSDAYHITAPDKDGRGIQTAMQLALKDAEIKSSDVDYINAHAASTPIGDMRELEAISQVFREHNEDLCVSSTKSMTGHCLGAAGSLESIFCILSIRDQVVPPTINLNSPPQNYSLNLVAEGSIKKKVVNTLNNSIGFGGTNAAVIFSKYYDER